MRVSAGEKLSGSIGQAVGLFRAAHALRTAPGVEVTVPLKPDTVLFDSHVGEPDPLAKLSDRQTLAPFDFPKNGELRVVIVFGEQLGLHS